LGNRLQIFAIPQFDDSEDTTTHPSRYYASDILVSVKELWKALPLRESFGGKKIAAASGASESSKKWNRPVLSGILVFPTSKALKMRNF
jgi:hypothetical protein